MKQGGGIARKARSPVRQTTRFLNDGKAMDETHRAPVGHMGFKLGPDWAMDFIGQGHDHQLRCGDRCVEADRKKAISFCKASSRTTSGPHRDGGARIPQIQRMGSSLVAVAQDGDSEPGWIGIWRTGRGWHGTNATGRAGFFAAIQIRVQMNR